MKLFIYGRTEVVEMESRKQLRDAGFIPIQCDDSDKLVIVIVEDDVGVAALNAVKEAGTALTHASFIRSLHQLRQRPIEADTLPRDEKGRFMKTPPSDVIS